MRILLLPLQSGIPVRFKGNRCPHKSYSDIDMVLYGNIEESTVDRLWTCFHGIQAAANAQSYSTSCNAQTTQNLKEDCTALESLYDATGGASWTTNTKWKTSDPLGEWHGVTVTSGRVQQLNLDSNNLSGTIPNLSALTKMEYLYLRENSLSGTIDTEDLPTGMLQFLFLGNNRLSGTIPDLNTFSRLIDLRLNNNSLSGEINVSHFPISLHSLVLSNNRLSGTIPDLRKLYVLFYLYLHGNSLSGTITAEYLPSNLTWLYLHGNNLSGTIPALSALPSLQRLSLSENNLSGTIPGTSAPSPVCSTCI